MTDTQVDKLINTLFDHNIYNNSQLYPDLFDPHANLKRYNLMLFANMVKNNKCSGAICEFGIYYGYTFNLLLNFFGKNHEYHGFDSFEGLSKPSIFDNNNFGCCHEGNMKVRIDTVWEYLKKEQISDYNIKLHKGWVNDTVPALLPDKIAFAHVDVDLFEPTMHILEYIIPKMEKGGVIILDDYMDKNWNGVESAAYMIQQRFNLIIHPLNIEVKPSHKYPIHQGYILF